MSDMLNNIAAAIAAFVASGIEGLVLAFDCATPVDRTPLKYIVRVSQRQNGRWYAYRNVHAARVQGGKLTGDYGAERQATSPDAATLAELKPWLEAQGELVALTAPGARLRTTYGRRGTGGTVGADAVRAQIDALKAAHAAQRATGKPADKPADKPAGRHAGK